MYAALTVVYFNKSAYAVAQGHDDEDHDYNNEVQETPSCETILDKY